MNNPPKIASIEKVEAGTFQPGFILIATISSDGKDFCVNIPEDVIGIINQQCLESLVHCLKESFYKVRPDLRAQ